MEMVYFEKLVVKENDLHSVKMFHSDKRGDFTLAVPIIINTCC